MQSKVFSINKSLNVAGRLLDLSTPRVMGILNVTPDSFYDGGKYTTEKEVIEHVGKLLEDGADIIDIGGYSTRPGAQEIPEEEELRRVTSMVNAVTRNFKDALISIDTFRSSVAKAAVEAGAVMINDVSGGRDKKMFETVSALQVPYVLMHTRGTPETMTQLTHYDLLLKDIVDYFHKQIFQLHELGVKDIVIDPGFGFAKTVKQNFELLSQLDYLAILGKPILVGLSRKSMIWRTLETAPEQALNGTTALNTIALSKGASMLRVHDVKEAVQCIKLMNQMSPNEIRLTPSDDTKS